MVNLHEKVSVRDRQMKLHNGLVAYSLRVNHVVAAYELNYQSRKVIVLGIYSDDIIGNA
jgi:hypothetical protein